MEASYLFNIGDKIVYPMQGIGIIEDIEEKTFSGKTQTYYIIKMLTNNMKIMLPSIRAEDLNVRLISDESTLENVLIALNNKQWDSEEMPPSKQRYKINMDKIKSGSFEKNAEVVYDLTFINKKKPLNSNEKQMLKNTRKLLINEITLIKQISEDEAVSLLKENIN